MKKHIVLALLAIFIFIVSCDSYKYEINTAVVISKVTIEDPEDCIVGLEYKLGPMLILDEIEVTPVQLKYISRNKINQLDIKIKYADFDSADNGFYYYLDGCRFGVEETEPTELKDLINYSDKIPGFVWLVRDNKKIERVLDSSETKTGSNELREL